MKFLDRSARYLIVEDDDDHAALIQRSLRRVSPQSTAFRVADGTAALRYLRGENPFGDVPMRPDVVLLDLKLPGMNGLQVLEAIKTDRDLRRIPVVMLTTSTADSDREAAYAQHVNSYLVKPMEFSGFTDLVREICHYWGEINCPAGDADGR